MRHTRRGEGAHIGLPEAVEVVRPDAVRGVGGCSWREAARIVGDGVAVVRPGCRSRCGCSWCGAA